LRTFPRPARQCAARTLQTLAIVIATLIGVIARAVTVSNVAERASGELVDGLRSRLILENAITGLDRVADQPVERVAHRVVTGGACPAITS
jgi:hypothetical protein